MTLRNDELNPQHPVTETLHENWHKLCFVLMRRLGKKEIVIGAEDMADVLTCGYTTIIAHDKHDGLHLILCDEEEAEAALRRSKQ